MKRDLGTLIDKREKSRREAAWEMPLVALIFGVMCFAIVGAL